MVRGSRVRDANPEPVDDLAPQHSLVVKHVRVSLKYLAVYSVALVNGAALLYIALRVWRYLNE
jgi:hypothetical protein